MLSRKGLSHVEFVISFIIFVGFLIFAFIFFNPLQSGRTLKSTMDYAWIEVNEETKQAMETYSVSIRPTAPSPAYIDISGIPSNYNATVEDIDGNIIPSYTDPLGVHFSIPSSNFVRIKYSPLFANGNPISGTQLNDGDYTISSSEKDDFYFERLFLELNNSYFSNYTGLKQRLNLANRVDFGFVVLFNTGDQINALNSIPDGVEVLSKEDRVRVIRSSGRTEYADLRVIAW